MSSGENCLAAILPRKLVHIAGAAFAFIALFNVYLAIAGIVLGILTFLALELIKPRIGKDLLRIVYRDGEFRSCAFEPLAYLLSIAALLMLSLFIAPGVCYASIIVLTVGDGFATIAGKFLRSPKMPRTSKTWSGFIAGVILSSAIGYIFVGPLILIGAIVGMITEAYVLKAENITVIAAAFLSMAFLSLFII